jgi:hypothetical protein
MQRAVADCVDQGAVGAPHRTECRSGDVEDIGWCSAASCDLPQLVVSEERNPLAVRREEWCASTGGPRNGPRNRVGERPEKELRLAAVGTCVDEVFTVSRDVQRIPVDEEQLILRQGNHRTGHGRIRPARADEGPRNHGSSARGRRDDERAGRHQPCRPSRIAHVCERGGRRFAVATLQRIGKFGGSAEPVGGDLLQCTINGGGDIRGHGGPKVANGDGRRRHHLRHDRLRRFAGEWRLTGQHLVEHRAQGEDVGPPGYVLLTHRLLGTHVLRSPDTHAAFGNPDATAPFEHQRNPEVGHQRPILVQEDIRRFHVPMHEAMTMCVVECTRDVACDADRIGHRQLCFAIEAIAQRLALDERHHVVRDAVRLA